MRANFDSDQLQISVTISGDADVAMREMRRLRESDIRAEAHLAALVPAPNHSGRMRRTEIMQFPVIAEGEGESALRQVDSLARQARIDANTERRMDEIIEELAKWTARAKRRGYWMSGVG